jgi:hypothetical protein
VRDDWRIHIEVEEEQAGGLLERLGLELGDEARELAKELEARRLAVSRDGDDVFVYAGSAAEAARAQQVIEAELRALGITAHSSRIEHWLTDEERWDDEPPQETWEEDELDRGYAPWEVRVQAASRSAAHELAERLETEGYSVEQRWQYVFVGAATKEEAEGLAARLHGEVEAGGDLVWETAPENPFAVFGGLAG